MCNNEKGLTLIEVILSTVLMVIVLTTLMNFFPQIARWNNHNMDKSQAINVAKNELLYWQQSLKSELDFNDYTALAEIESCQTDAGNMCYFSTEEISEVSMRDKYVVKINVWEKPETDLTGSESGPVPGMDKVHQIYIQILDKETHQTVSDTYGYVFIE